VFSLFIFPLYRPSTLHSHFSVILALGDHLLPVLLFSTLSPDEKSEFRFLYNSFRLISKRSSQRESLISPDLVRIQRFVDYCELNQVKHGVLV
jgi:hypothetical protein